MKPHITLIILALLILLPTVSALEFDNVLNYDKTKDEIVVTNAFNLGADLIKARLQENGCDEDMRYCQATIPISFYENGRLIEGRRFYTIDGENKYLQDVRWSKLEYWGLIDDYETQCYDGKEIYSEENKTSYIPKICEQVKVGSHEGWISFTEETEVVAGDYLVKFSGEKKPSRIVDWQIKIKGEWTTPWAIWGNISLGDEAEVTLNSPADGSIAYTNSVTFNASANVTNGAYLTNMSFCSNITGSWGCGDSVLLGDSLSESTRDNSTRVANNDFNYNVTALVEGYVTNITAVRAAGAFTPRMRVIITQGATTLVDKVGIADTPNGTGITQVWLNSSDYTTTIKTGTFNIRIIKYDGTGDIARGDAPFSYTGSLFTITNQYINTHATYDVGFYSLTYTSLNFSSTQTWSKTIPAGSTNWSVEACDTDGDCYYPPAYIVSLDATSPQIALNYPTALIDYAKLNGTLQLNFSATDTNLDSVWYDYNGTNVTIAGAVSGVANLSNITLSTKKNITIYANDTAGNLNATTFSWDYKVFATDVQYSPTTITTSSETFKLVTTKNSNISSVSAKLWYDGVSYDSTIITSGNGVNITNSIEIPSGASTRNFFWAITLFGTSGTTYVNTSTLTQNVSNLSIAYCTSPSITGLTLNFTTYNSENNSLLNTTFQSSFSFYSYGGTGEIVETYTYQNTSGLRSNYMFCLNSSGENVTLNGLIEYAATGYNSRSYILQDAIIGNFTQNIPLYLTPDTSTDIVTITVQDQNYDPVSGALVTIQEWNVGTNTYSTIGMLTTGSDGRGSIDLVLYNKWYRATVTLDGVVSEVTDNKKLDSTSWVIPVSLGVGNPYDLFGSISHNLDFDNVTNITTFSWSDSSGYTNTGCLIVKNSTSLGMVTIYSDCVETVAGTINYQLVGDGNYQIYGYIELSADYGNVTQIMDYLSVTLGEPSLTTKVSPYGKVLTFIFVGTSALVGVSLGNPIPGIALLIGSLFGASKMGWIKGLDVIWWGLISVALIIGARQSRRGY